MNAISPKNERIWLRRLGCRGVLRFSRLFTLYFDRFRTKSAHDQKQSPATPRALPNTSVHQINHRPEVITRHPCSQPNHLILPNPHLPIRPLTSYPAIAPRHALVGEASPGKAASDAELRSNTLRLIPPGKQTNKQTSLCADKITDQKSRSK